MFPNLLQIIFPHTSKKLFLQKVWSCVRLVYVCAMNSDGNSDGCEKLRRWDGHIEQKWIDRINRDKRIHGLNSNSAFVRYIIVKFFEDFDNKKTQTQRR